MTPGHIGLAGACLYTRHPILKDGLVRVSTQEETNGRKRLLRQMQSEKRDEKRGKGNHEERPLSSKR